MPPSILKDKYDKCDKCKTTRNLSEAPNCPVCIHGYKRPAREGYIKKPDAINIAPLTGLSLEDYIASLSPEVFSRSRFLKDIQPRIEAALILRTQYKLSFLRIAAILHYSDHTTVRNFCYKYSVGKL